MWTDRADPDDLKLTFLSLLPFCSKAAFMVPRKWSFASCNNVVFPPRHVRSRKKKNTDASTEACLFSSVRAHKALLQLRDLSDYCFCSTILNFKRSYNILDFNRSTAAEVDVTLATSWQANASYMSDNSNVDDYLLKSVISMLKVIC